MIKQIQKQLCDVPAGGWFYIRGYAAKNYIKTNRQHIEAGTVVVVDLKTGDMANLMESLTVVEFSKGGE